MGPGALAQVLRQSALSSYSHPQLLVGLQTSDDAAVFRLSETQALVQTVDFFAPVVDDPFTYGAIAAANSVSDIYAMGGDVLFALNIAAFPDDLPGSILAEIFRGGAATMARAGGVIAGGHTVTDPRTEVWPMRHRHRPSRSHSDEGGSAGGRPPLPDQAARNRRDHDRHEEPGPPAPKWPRPRSTLCSS